jgi:hypothetical protein
VAREYLEWMWRSAIKVISVAIYLRIQIFYQFNLSHDFPLILKQVSGKEEKRSINNFAKSERKKTMVTP